MPQPEVSWVREGGYSILPEGSTQQVNGDLKIIRVQEQDEGMYRCEIRTKDGVVDISGPAYVNVLGKYWVSLMFDIFSFRVKFFALIMKKYNIIFTKTSFFDYLPFDTTV